MLGSLLPSAPGTHAGAVAAKRSLQVMASFDAGCTALGAAPFGADLAVLCWGEPSGGTAIEGAASASMLLNDSTTADELPVSSPAGGTAPSDAASTLTSSSGGGGAAEGGQPGGAAPSQDASPAQQQPAEQQQEEQQQQGAPPAQQEQQLALCFYTRSGQLLAADALPVSAPAAERRWHQLAVLYPGDADLRLAAAAAGGAGARPAPPTPSSTAGTPAGSVRTSRDGSPAKPAGGSPAPSSPRADGGEEQLAADSNGQQQAQQQQSVQRYQWWRDGEEPLYLISGPQVGCPAWLAAFEMRAHAGRRQAVPVPRPAPPHPPRAAPPSCPQGIIAGRPRDGNDRVAWLAERGRYADALAVAEEDASGGLRSLQSACLPPQSAVHSLLSAMPTCCAGLPHASAAPRLLPDRPTPALPTRCPPPAVQAPVREALGERFLQALAQEGRYAETAELCPRVLKVQGWVGSWLAGRLRSSSTCALLPALCHAFP